MFEPAIVGQTPTGVPTTAEITPHDLHRILDRLAGAAGPATDAERIDVLRTLEELKSAAEGLQVQVTADLAAARRVRDEAAGVPRERQGRGLGHMVGLARRESPWRGQRHLQLAQVAVRELPCAYAALRAGKITERHLSVFARETTCLTREHREHVDQVLAADMDALERHTPKTLAAKTAGLAATLDPAAVVTRRRIAETQRHTSLRPAPDTMTWFSAVLPVKDGVAIHVALEQAAVHAQATGDPRTKSQLMADTLVERVTGQPAQYAPEKAEGGLDTTLVPRVGSTTEHEGDPIGSVVEPACASGVETTPTDNAAGDGVVVNLVMTHTQLFGTGPASEGAAHLDHYGPIDADLARQLVKHSDRVWLRRLYTDPDSGQLVQMDSRQRCFPDGLKILIRLRDQTCRTPWCGAPIRHTDHITEYAHAGATTYLNGQGLCEACNHAKQDNWWARPGPDGSIEITTTTGHTYRSHPPEPPGPDEYDEPDEHDDSLDTRTLRSPGSTTETWPTPAWIAQDRHQLLTDGWTETTPAAPPADCGCGC